MEISSLDELETNGNFKLSGDIDASDFKDALDNFNGMLDGNGFTIHNLNSKLIHTLSNQGILKDITFKDIEIDSELDEVGVVGVNKGVIKDVSVQNVNIISTGSCVGGIAGVNNSTIKNCSVTGTVCTESSRIGLITGETKNSNAEIKNCSVSGKVVGNLLAGGIAGGAGYVEDCTAECTVLGSYSIGGILGENTKNSKILNTKFDGNIEGDRRIGGIVGIIENKCLIKNCTIEADLKGDMKIGGFIGNTKKASVSITNTHCSGNLVGIRFVGGMIGRSVKNISITGSTCDVDLYGYEDVRSILNVPPKEPKENINNINLNYLYIQSEKTVKKPSDSIDTLDLQSVYMSVNNIVSTRTNTVKVSNEDQLRQCEPFDRIELTDDIRVESDSTVFNIFFGRVDGKGHTISNLSASFCSLISESGVVKNITLTGNSENSECLNFGLLTEYNYGTSKNITVQNSEIRSDSVYTGVLIGINRGGIKKCNIKNSSVTSKYSPTGVLVGENSNLVKECTIEDCVVDGNNKVGGLTGSLFGECVDSSVKDCSVSGNHEVGGFVGRVNTFGEIKYSTSQNNTVSGKCYVGGFSGLVNGDIMRCRADSEVTGDKIVGGFLGKGAEATIDYCLSQEKIVSGFTQVGGFAGNLVNFDLYNSFTTNKIDSATKTGGLVGICDYCRIENCFSKSVIQSDDAGALIYPKKEEDLKHEEITNCYWDIETSGIRDSKVGTGVITSSVEELTSIVLITSE